MNGFNASLTRMVDKSAAKNIHEIGCGEGYWVMQWQQQGIDANGSDFSSKVIDLARRNAVAAGLSAEIFKQRSIYDVDPELDSAELIVCCEVLEHLENPEDGLRSLHKIVKQHLILSVPREPVWRILNMARGKYLLSLVVIRHCNLDL